MCLKLFHNSLSLFSFRTWILQADSESLRTEWMEAMQVSFTAMQSHDNVAAVDITANFTSV